MINRLVAYFNIYIFHLLNRQYHKDVQNKNQTILSWLVMVKVRTCIWRTANKNHVKEEKNNKQQNCILQKCNQCQHYFWEEEILRTLLICIKHTIEMIKSRKMLLCYMTHEKTITNNTYMYQRNAKLGDILNTCLILFATADWLMLL